MTDDFPRGTKGEPSGISHQLSAFTKSPGADPLVAKLEKRLGRTPAGAAPVLWARLDTHAPASDNPPRFGADDVSRE